MSHIRYTPEQADVLDQIAANDGIVLVKAGAGSGKSFMARRTAIELKVKSGLYTAFNKAIVEEGVEKFAGTPVMCKTLHALAYKYAKPEKPIKEFSYKCIEENIVYPEKRKIIDAINDFFVSSSSCMYDFMEEYFKDHPRMSYMATLATKYIEGMAEGTVNPTFNFMLKSLHLLMLEGEVVIEVDLMIMDEINDVTAVALEIFKLVKAPKKLGLGESHQAIYEFLNLVDGFEELKDEATTMHLTQSYRCSEDVAERIENKMRSVMCKDFRFKGTDKPVLNGETLYCTMTNAAIVDHIQERLEQGKSFTLLRKPADIFAAPLAVLAASRGKKPFQDKYAFLVDAFDEYTRQSHHKSYFAYLKAEVDDVEINSAVSLLAKMKGKGVNLYEVYKEAKEVRPDPKYTISTVFTSKGLEFENVWIADDLNSNFTLACDGELDDDEALIAKRCYYVAASRCGRNLENSVL